VTESRLHWLTQFGVYTATPWAFVVVFLYGLGWASFGTLDATGIATLVVWSMTLFIQRAQHRDTQAIHAKLDELLRAHHDARSELAKLDEDEPEEIEQFRKGERGASAGGRAEPRCPPRVSNNLTQENAMADIKEHMKIVGKDGAPVGTVDRVEGDRIKLTRKDSPAGHQDHHHYIDMQLVGAVEGDTVKLSLNADAVQMQEESGQKA
jgi:low affinity Fe/Cu permease